MDANVDLYDKRRRLFHTDRYEFAARRLREKGQKNAILLDAACGTGYGSNILKQINPKGIIGLDICQKTVEYANKKYSDERCLFKVCDIIDMSLFNEGTFDAVISFETIEHLDNPLVFLKNINRILKEKGILIISTPNKWGATRDHKFDYDYKLLREHLDGFFDVEGVYIQNSGCTELWINRGAQRRIAAATPENIEEAECFIAVCCKRPGKGNVRRHDDESKLQ